MAKKTSNKVLIEGVLPSIHASRVDREAGVIYGVRLGGLESKNKRRYKEAAYKNGIAKGEYSNRPCNVNHVEEGKQVAVESRLGMWHDGRWEDSPEPGPVADLHYLKSHPLSERVCEAAERKALARSFGMSHIAEAGQTSQGADGWLVIESIDCVKSIDLVADPATVNGLFEHTEKKPMKQSIKALIESACNFPFQKRLWEGFIKDEDACKRITEEIESPESDKPVEVANAAFDALSVSVVKDGSLAPKAKADKVDAIATLQAKMLNGEEPTPIPEPKKDDGNPKESYGVRKASSLCESLKFKPTATQLTLISEAAEPSAKQLAEEFCRLSLVKPEQEITSAGRVEPIEESTKPKPAQTAEELAARIA